VSEEKLENQPIHRIWRWLRNQIVQEVPEDSALCELTAVRTSARWENGKAAIGA